jgi:hypothetical protein
VLLLKLALALVLLVRMLPVLPLLLVHPLVDTIAASTGRAWAIC